MFVTLARRRGEAVLNGAAVLEAIFLPASAAGQYPRIASSGEVTLERGQPAVPRRAAVLPPLQDVDLRPCSFVIADPVAAGCHPCCWHAACPGGSPDVPAVGTLAPA